jgi:hypothetical protein
MLVPVRGVTPVSINEFDLAEGALRMGISPA